MALVPVTESLSLTPGPSPFPVPRSRGLGGKTGKPAVPGAQTEAALDLLPWLRGYWSVAGTTSRPCGCSQWHSLHSHHRQRFLLRLFLLPVLWATSRSPGSPQGLGLQTPALVTFPSSPSARACPGEVDQRPRTFLSSQSHPPVVFLPVQVAREETSALPSILATQVLGAEGSV